jgi:hypothetical protein
VSILVVFVVVSVTMIVLSIVVVVPMTMIVLSIAVVVPTTMIVLSIAVVVPTTMIVLSIVPATLVVRLVFHGSYEVHRSITGIVLSAVLAPIPRMVGRYMQIDGWRRGRLRLDQHRLCIDQRRRRGVAEPNLAIDTGCHLSR